MESWIYIMLLISCVHRGARVQKRSCHFTIIHRKATASSHHVQVPIYLNLNKNKCYYMNRNQINSILEKGTLKN